MPGWTPAELFHFFLRAFASRTVWIGIGLLLAFFHRIHLVLSWADYSYVLPASSISTLMVALLGAFRPARDGVARCAGPAFALICLGVFVVGHTPPRTTEL